MSRTPGSIATPERERAGECLADLAGKVTAIQRQKNLTTLGKQARIAAAVVAAQTELRELRDAEMQRVTERRDQVQRALFGDHQPDDSRVISIRDAADRVSRVKTAEQMVRLMNTAERSGDTVLLRAAAVEAYSRRNPAEPAWRHITATWAAQQPGGTDAVDELELIGMETTDGGHRLSREHAFSVGLLPAEVRGLTTARIERLAGQADSVEELPPSRAEITGQRLAAMVRGHAEPE